ncbi:MAG: EAL domain-containing protein, partial [Chromatiales bacterium]|nr:EAL domain-containing protein [Chromatiales bacterium]
ATVSFAQPARSVELTARVNVNDAAIDQLSASFDRNALLSLHQHSAGITRINQIDALIEHFSDTVFEVMEKTTNISLYNLEGETAMAVPVFSRDRQGTAKMMPISSAVLRSVLERSEAVAFLDSDDDMDVSEILHLSDVRAGLCAPVRDGERVTGVAQVDCRGKLLGALDYQDLEVFAVLTHQFALAAHNIRLTGELHDTVSQLESARSEMDQLALYDSLTGLYNRRLFIDRLDQAVTAAARNRRRACLLYLDLDHFNRVNDTLGHNVGDQLLHALADRLRKSVRANDTVARLGGDEFAILIDEITEIDDVRIVCEKLLEALRQPVFIDGHQLATTTSIGIAVSSNDGGDATTLLKNADMALYRAKQRARDTYQFFTDDMNREMSERVSLEAELRRATAAGELVPHFQPLFRLTDQHAVGVEALLRWQHPTRGLLGPDSFIWLAEQSGLIVPIGDWVMRNACEQLANATGDVANLRLSVNLSTRQLSDVDLPDRVAQILGQTALPAQRLELEITESMLMEDGPSIANLHSLREIGVSLAIDDFGTGYSSFSYLKELPVDVLKVDRSFVKTLPDATRDADISAAIIAMAHKLGVAVVAEGIETLEQLAFLRDNRCDFGQGFLWGQPAALPINTDGEAIFA